MLKTAIRAILLLGIGVLLLTAAGCGGDDDDEGSAAETQVVAVEATESEESEESEEADALDFASAGNCQELVGLGMKVATALSGTDTSDLDTTGEFLDEFADQAPEEIRADFEVIAKAYGKIAEVMGDVDFAAGETPDAEQLQELQELSNELNTAEVTAANENITAWVEENC
jgi:hypothetical protein